MFLEGIEFPDQIVDAIREERLVVFAGAGVSMGKPTNLPMFKVLTDKIAEGTGQKVKQRTPCEVVLGELQANGMSVHEEAARIMTGDGLTHNELHEAIVDLFVDPAKVKIVTTNYDRMFEQVLEERKVPYQVFDAPALPLGSDVHGIVHLHGNIENPRYMVVTDEDFGRAYLTEGYASRFLVRLFETYTVLFIGYSYTDTIIRYLTRAISRTQSPKRFVMTDNGKANWYAMKIQPIVFPKKRFDKLNQGIIKLGDRTRREMLGWENLFCEYADHPPKDPTMIGDIRYCLKHIDKTRMMAGCIRGKAWAEHLDQRGIFDHVFSDPSQADVFDQVWSDWLLDTFLGKEDDYLKLLMMKRQSSLSAAFADQLIRRLEYGGNAVADEDYRAYIALLDPFIREPEAIGRLILHTCERRLIPLCLHLIRKLFRCSLAAEKEKWAEDAYAFECRFAGSYDVCDQAWEACRSIILPEKIKEVLGFVKETIEEVHYHYAEVGMASPEKEPYSISVFLDIEEMKGRDPLLVLNRMMTDAAEAAQTYVRGFLKSFLDDCLRSESVLMKKMALRCLRGTTVFSPDRKLELLFKHTSIRFMEGREQVFLLVNAVFNDLSEEKRNALIDQIEALDLFDDRINAYRKYSWCLWIRKVCTDNARINALLEQIESEYRFDPLEDPEKVFEMPVDAGPDDASPISGAQMLQMDPEALIEKLETYREEGFEGPTRWGLLNVFSGCIRLRHNLTWTMHILDKLIEKEEKDTEIWDWLMRGISLSDFTIEESIGMLERLSGYIALTGNTLEMAKTLRKILGSADIGSVFAIYEDSLRRIAQRIWTVREESLSSFSGVVDAAENTTSGMILQSFVDICWHSGRGPDEAYKEQFKEVLSSKTREEDIAVCILAGHFNVLCMTDRRWANTVLAPILTGRRGKKRFLLGWEGMASYAAMVPGEIREDMIRICMQAVRHMDWMDQTCRKHFIERYVWMTVDAPRDPSMEYIPAFYKEASIDDRVLFAGSILHIIQALDDTVKVRWWRGCLKSFLIYRYQNKPVEMEDREKAVFARWVPELGSVSREAGEIVFSAAFGYGMTSEQYAAAFAADK